MIRIRQDRPFEYGYNPITAMGEVDDNTMMDFGIIKLAKDQVHTLYDETKETAILLIQGGVILNLEKQHWDVRRESCFESGPWVLHIPKCTEVKIEGLSCDSELCITKTTNNLIFRPRLYTPEECVSEEMGKGTLKEASTRIVRTVFDYSNVCYSNLVLGEVIDYPGKWSDYPPYHHPQPEICYYKFLPEQGYGFCQLGDDVVKIINNDTVKILNDVTHPQAAAPGYAMYYVRVIRHLDGNPYESSQYPAFDPQHVWVKDKSARIWPDK